MWSAYFRHSLTSEDHWIQFRYTKGTLSARTGALPTSAQSVQSPRNPATGAEFRQPKLPPAFLGKYSPNSFFLGTTVGQCVRVEQLLILPKEDHLPQLRFGKIFPKL
jgi:hypothetical protein